MSIVDGGLYGPGSEAWRLNRESMLLLGAGPRALLLQIAHPLVAEGVAEHSDFRSDPWSRLAATLRSYLRIVYGTATVARGEIRRLNQLHREIGGEIRDPSARERHGSRYEARDPELSLWVHATLVDSTIAAYEAWIEPLSWTRRARYYEETKPAGRAFGIPSDLLPEDIDAFEAYLASMLGPGGPIVIGDTARDLASSILRPPLGPAVPLGLGDAAGRLAAWLDTIPAGAYEWLMWPAIGLLPDRLREGYGLRWGWRERAVSAWLVGTWRAWRLILPRSFRQMPQALAADRRIGALESPEVERLAG
ncbi:MAG TPA: oxygenase MpaB family protein [Candidatus Limnocylindrales bacterium]|nr:oxygenase MpaB family protein [Candidatus Limnocylindrales bacterium]